MEKRSVADWLAGGVRWVAILVVLLVTAEIFTRIDDALTADAPFLGSYTHDRLLTRDSVSIRGRPDYRFQKWRMNNEGFRGVDIAPTAAPGVTRVVTLGASETFGLYEAEGEEYPARMQSLLDSLAPGRFQVINAALAGMSISAMVPYYKQAVAPLGPRFVFLYPSPSLYLENSPPPVEFTMAPMPPPVEPSWAVDREGLKPRLPARARDALKEIVPATMVTAYREWRLERRRATYPADSLWQDVPQDRMRIFEQQLERLIATIQVSGALPVLVTHTTHFTGSPEAVAGPERRHLINLEAEYYPRASDHVMVAVDSVANNIMRRVAAEHGAAVAEVEGRIPPTTTYFADYAHFTDIGADSIARILTATVLALQQSGASPPTATPPATLRP